MAEKKYKPEEIRRRLKKFARKLGRFPYYSEIDKNPDLPHSTTISDYLGPLSEVAKSIGFPFKTPRPRYDSEEMLERLKRLARRLGRFPMALEIDRAGGMPNYQTYIRYFGSREKLAKRIGFPKPPRQIKRIYDPNKVFARLKRLAKKLGRSPYCSEIDKDPYLPSVRLVRRLFGPMATIAKKLGYPYPVRKYNKHELLLRIIQLARRLGRCPSWKEVEEDPLLPSWETVRRQIGPLKKIARMIHYPPPPTLKYAKKRKRAVRRNGKR